MPEASDEPSIQRTTELDLDVEEVWDLISTAEGWASWLVDDAILTIAPGSGGVVIDDGAERSVRIETLVGGRSVRFSWWDRDDPSSASYVELEVIELPGNRARLDITERFGSTTSVSAPTGSVSTARAGTRWEVRLLMLCVLALPALVKA